MDKVEKTDTVESAPKTKKEKTREKKSGLEVDMTDAAPPFKDAVIEVIEARSQPVSDELNRAVQDDQSNLRHSFMV